MGSLGAGELLVILVIVLIIFGASRVPQLGEGLGRGIRNFRRALRGEDEPEAGKPDKPAGAGGEAGEGPVRPNGSARPS
jgi:sec-independent protein translocase protein TatA